MGADAGPADARGHAAGRGRAHQDQGEQRARAQQRRERHRQRAAEEHGHEHAHRERGAGGPGEGREGGSSRQHASRGQRDGRGDQPPASALVPSPGSGTGQRAAARRRRPPAPRTAAGRRPGRVPAPAAARGEGQREQGRDGEQHGTGRPGSRTRIARDCSARSTAATSPSSLQPVTLCLAPWFPAEPASRSPCARRDPGREHEHRDDCRAEASRPGRGDDRRRQ